MVKNNSKQIRQTFTTMAAGQAFCIVHVQRTLFHTNKWYVRSGHTEARYGAVPYQKNSATEKIYRRLQKLNQHKSNAK